MMVSYSPQPLVSIFLSAISSYHQATIPGYVCMGLKTFLLEWTCSLLLNYLPEFINGFPFVLIPCLVLYNAVLLQVYALPSTQLDISVYVSQSQGSSFIGCSISAEDKSTLYFDFIIPHPTRGYRALGLVTSKSTSVRKESIDACPSPPPPSSLLSMIK